ncbi:hypothetical protein D9C73_026055 [Collichthys lucidus]|uniref:Uncharacterized protein n=1 Tax=Collichthys lucidus TaxID=240159 RepID=A0A4U5VSW0_COLLU|nr:hypothetical protein D9C73_026055 [Collichthys lucidus]
MQLGENVGRDVCPHKHRQERVFVGTSRNGRPSPIIISSSTTHGYLAVSQAAPVQFTSLLASNKRKKPQNRSFVFYDTSNLCPARFGRIAVGRTPIYVLSGPVLCERPDPLLCLSDGVHRPECGDSVSA